MGERAVTPGDYVEAESGSRAYRGVVADCDHAEGFVTLDQVEYWAHWSDGPNDYSAWVPLGTPITLDEYSYLFSPLRFRGSTAGGGFA